MGKGIDYGMGATNIDRETGIRFGVISAHDVGQSWYESAESQYGEPHCPKCGNEACDYGDDIHEDVVAEIVDELREAGNEDVSADGISRDEHYECGKHSCGDYACDSCRYLFDGDQAFGEDPIDWTIEDGEYTAQQSGDDSDIFILRSPYYTRAAYCSPCAPGACYLTSPCDDGERAYCFGHDMFEGGVAPYPVYSVMTNELVLPS